MARRTTSTILSVIFGILALDAWAQVLLVAFGHSDDPPALTALQATIGLTAAATAWGSWHRERWTWASAIAYGAITSGMLAALPSLLKLPAESRRGIWTGAGVVFLLALLAAVYFRSDAQRQTPPRPLPEPE